MTQQIEPHILKKFQIIEKLGKGAYGIVWKAIDRKLKQVVALKKVFDAFHNATDAQRTFRQVMFLQELNGHENIIRLLNIIRAQNNKDIYLVFDFMETDLHVVIRAGILEQIHRRYVIYQILKALKYMHSGELIHRDLKPSNILLDSQCNVKIADFGLARSLLVKQDETAILTQYVATRWYRAPEILLGSTKYSKAVDMWSVGCIIGQLITGKAIFPGNSTLNQIQRILELTWKPSAKEIEDIESPLAVNIISNINLTKKKSFQSLFPGASEDTIDIIKGLLAFSPHQRLTAQQALKHRYVKDFHDEQSEIFCKEPIRICMDDNKKFSIREYRESLYTDITKRKKEQKKKWQMKYLQKLGINPKEMQKQSDEEIKKQEKGQSIQKKKIKKQEKQSEIEKILKEKEKKQDKIKMQQKQKNKDNLVTTYSSYSKNQIKVQKQKQKTAQTYSTYNKSTENNTLKKKQTSTRPQSGVQKK